MSVVTADDIRDSVAETAERLVDGGAMPSDLDRTRLRPLAWRLKEICYGAWSSAPQRAARAAEALARLGGQRVDAALNVEIEALAAWTAGIAHLTRGEMADAVERFDTAAERFHVLGENHRAAETQVPKIMALTMLGRHDDAVASALATHAEFLHHGDRLAAAKVSLNLGSVNLRRDAFGDAARHYRDAAVLFARAGDQEHSIMADIGMGDALTALGELAEAQRIYARARMRASAHGFPVLQAMEEESSALLALARGGYGAALAGLESSRRGYERLAMPQLVAIAEKQLADAYLELRLLPEAIALYEDVLARFEAQSMPDDVAWALAQRGRAEALRGRAADASALLARAEGMFAAQPNPVGRAAVTLARAELALASVVSTDAIGLAKEARDGFLTTGLRERALRAELVLAQALLDTGAHADARALFETLLGRCRELELVVLEVRCLAGMGAAALALGNRSAAHAELNAAVALFEHQRTALPADDIQTAFLADHLRPYRDLVRMALEDHVRAPSSDTAGDVLRALDRFRARSLSERLVEATGGEHDAATADLRSRVGWLHRRLQRREDDAEVSPQLVAELRRAERELLERVRREKLVARGTAAVAEQDDLDIDALRAALNADEAAVEFGVAGDRVFACIVTRDAVVVRANVCGWLELEDAMRSARFQMESLRHGVTPVASHLEMLRKRADARMRQLHDLLWAPLAPALLGARRVVIVPHGALASLPFAALPDGGAYLGERHELAIAASARFLLRGLRRAPVPARDALILGVDEQLPHAIAEATFVAGLFDGARLLLREQAGVQAFVEASPTADVIHLACHAQFRSDNPMFSALYLHDGTVSVEMAERLRLRAATVVLSGCETGLAQESPGDELVGLVRAFFMAGAARVLASLWPVDDAATADVMTGFYGGLQAGLAPAAALRAAQARVRASRPHPFYWASFSLHGGW